MNNSLYGSSNYTYYTTAGTTNSTYYGHQLHPDMRFRIMGLVFTALDLIRAGWTDFKWLTYHDTRSRRLTMQRGRLTGLSKYMGEEYFYNSSMLVMDMDIASDFVMHVAEMPRLRVEPVDLSNPGFDTVRLSEFVSDKKIILPKESVGDLLKRIADLQADSRTEIARRKVQEKTARVETKILSLVA